MEDDFEKVHEVLEQYQDAIIAIGKILLEPLDNDEREYVITKCHDEFRFWRVYDCVKNTFPVGAK